MKVVVQIDLEAQLGHVCMSHVLNCLSIVWPTDQPIVQVRQAFHALRLQRHKSRLTHLVNTQMEVS